MHHVDGESFSDIAARLGIQRQRREDAGVSRYAQNARAVEPMKAPAPLRTAIERDLKPARPLARPAIRALALVPFAIAIVVGVPALHAFRPDMTAIGFLRAWGFSIGQAVAGCTIVAVALRESIPGRALSRAALAAIIALGVALPAGVLLLTTSSFTIGPADHAVAEGFACFRTSALAALPALVFAASAGRARVAAPSDSSRRAVRAGRRTDGRRRPAALL